MGEPIQMQTHLHLDMVFITKLGLKLSEAIVFAHLVARLDPSHGFIPYSNKRLCEELPCVTGKRDTMFRHVSVLVERGLILKEVRQGVQCLGIKHGVGWTHKRAEPKREADKAKPEVDMALPAPSTDITLKLRLKVEIEQ